MPRLYRYFLFTLFLGVCYSITNAQDTNTYEKQFWGMGFFNWRLNEKWVYNQDIGVMHTFSDPAFNRLFLRSQVNRQLTGSFSLHGGLIFIYSQNEEASDAIELRPWMGAKLRWPSFWRFNFMHYARFEQRFLHTFYEDSWDKDFRVRYKLATDIPINHHSLIDKTYYGVLSYEFFSVSFDEDVRFTKADIHRFDVGIGYRQNVKNRYEVVLIAFNAQDETTESYGFSSMVLFLKYKHYIHWL